MYSVIRNNNYMETDSLLFDDFQVPKKPHEYAIFLNGEWVLDANAYFNAIDKVEAEAFLNETDKKNYLPKMRASVQLMKEDILSLKNTRQIALPADKTGGLKNQKISLPLQGDNESYWQVQAGAYASLPTALKKAQNIEQILGETGIVQILPFGDLWRVRVFGLENEKKALEVSRLLQKNKLPCFIIAPDTDGNKDAPNGEAEYPPLLIKKDKE